MTESSTENIGVQTEIATTQEVIQRTESNLLDLKGDIDAEDLLTAINSSRDEGNKLTIQTINNLDGEGLSNFIETSFKTNNEWLTYSEMKNNPFFGFMVQAGIKRLSDKLGDKKYDDNGNEVENGNGENEDNNIGKTLSERLEEIGGIDNVYGENTKSLVSLVQKILNINVDGFAGPQFFAKLCSELTNNKIGEFQVKGYDENNYPFNFDNDVDTETSESIGITESTETTNNTVEIQQKSTEYKLSWGENINFTMNCYDGISISNEKQNLKNGIIGYKLNLPDFCELKTTNIYVYMKDGKLSYGNPELNSGISKYLTIKKVNDTTFYLKIKDEIKPKYKSANIDNLDVTYDTSKITVTKNNTDIVAVANIDGNKRKCIVREDENNNWHCYITNQKDGSLSISPDFKAKLTNGKLTISLKDNNDKKEDFKNKVNDVLQKLDTIKGKGDISVAYEDNQNKIHYSIYHPHKQYPTLSNYNDNGKYRVN